MKIHASTYLGMRLNLGTACTILHKKKAVRHLTNTTFARYNLKNN